MGGGFDCAPDHSHRYGGWEFDLAEEPWWCESTEAIATRYFICDLLETLMTKVRKPEIVSWPSKGP